MKQLQLINKQKIDNLIRPEMPKSCVVCNKSLQKKSEHYGSKNCFNLYKDVLKLPFLSKWKLRKVKAINDPLIVLREKSRQRSKSLVKSKRIQKKPCTVCGYKDVILHHEDYSNPWDILWLCEKHHTEYHDGKITLFGGKLKWPPAKLVPNGYHGKISKKYKNV